jgi:uncharacterized DUF497 family protein
LYLFTWDENKNALNKKNHGVSFEESETVFYDENALLEYDENHSDNEDRFRILGYSDNGNLLLVVHCIRDEFVIRIISARKATETEKQNYVRSLNL